MISVVIPNIFTPNADNMNDKFVIKNLMQWNTRELTVLNRWGQVVYYNNSYNNDWDGTFMGSGRVVSPGVYFGVLFISKNGEVEQHTFDVTIIW